MNVDLILNTLNRHHVAYMLIGGMNFLLRHKPVLTFDVDLWIEDDKTNRARCEAALTDLDAQWGKRDDDWKPVSEHPSDWLGQQPVVCLTSPHGAIDIFRHVAGLDDWSTAAAAASREKTASGIDYLGLSDEDMPNGMNEADLKRTEEDRRERNWDPAVRWRVIQETITWAESQATVRRNTKQSRLIEQQEKLAGAGLKDKTGRDQDETL